MWKYPRSIVHGKKLISMSGVTKEVIADIAAKTEGFSGRELTKMVISWHDAAFTLPDPVLTPELMLRVLNKFQLQHKLKETWTAEEKLLYEKMNFADEEAMTGSQHAQPQSDEFHSHMKEEQEKIMNEINEGRADMKNYR